MGVWDCYQCQWFPWNTSEHTYGFVIRTDHPRKNTENYLSDLDEGLILFEEFDFDLLGERHTTYETLFYYLISGFFFSLFFFFS